MTDVLMRCPVDHTTVDPPAEAAFVKDWATTTSWANVIGGLLAEGRCPCCPGMQCNPADITTDLGTISYAISRRPIEG